MRYRVTLKHLIDGQWQARCEAGPLGPVWRDGASREEAVERLKAEMHYQLEWCPCSSLNAEALHLDLHELPSRQWGG